MPTKPPSKPPTGRSSASSTRTVVATRPSSSASTKPTTGFTNKPRQQLDLFASGVLAKDSSSKNREALLRQSKSAENAQVKVGSPLEEAVARALAVGIDGDYARLWVWRLDAVQFLDHLGAEGFVVKQLD